MCNCITKVEDSAIKRLVDEKGVTVLSGGLKQIGFSLKERSGMGVSTYTDYEYRGTRPKRNGMPSKPFTKRTPVLHSYCPFCGEKKPK